MISRNYKKDFPIFKYNPDLVYLDSTATTLKPIPVIKAINDYYQKYTSNIHRGIYKISETASRQYELSRQIVSRFINAPSQSEIIFTRNTTESINLVAYCLSQLIIKQNDEIVISIADHHSNFVPWQQLCHKTGAKLSIIDIDMQGRLDIYENHYITKKTKILALPYISNV